MINQLLEVKQIKMHPIDKRNLPNLFKLPFCLLFFLLSCERNNIERKKMGEFDMEGIFINGSIPDGVIKYYIPNTDNVVAMKEFSNGVLNGKATNYYNSKVIQKSNYINGKESGFNEVYDSSTSYLRQKSFYNNGRKIGPFYEFDQNGRLLFFDFSNFENKVLYTVGFDSTFNQYYSDEIEKLEHITVDEALVNNQRKLRVFSYLIYPPKSNVTYKICYMDNSEKIIDSTNIAKSDQSFYWEEYINYPKENQKLALIITKYDSLSMKNQTMINYLENYHKK